MYECSNQGTCDYGRGQCQCFQASRAGTVKYRAISSDGSGNKGTRGDCGYLDVPLTGCTISTQGGLVVGDVCGGQGKCNNVTKTCDCMDGFSGITCALRDCPKVCSYSRWIVMGVLECLLF